MTGPERPRPGMTAQAEADRAARVQREAAALRANLRRRKAQRVRLEQDGSDREVEDNETKHNATD